MNDHGEADRQGAPGALPARSSRQERRQGAPATAADAGELVEARGDIVGQVSAVAWSWIVRVLRRFVPDMQDLRPARTPARRGRCPGSAATLHTIKGSASTVGASALAGRASELEQALRRADRLRGMEILAGIRLDELRTCAMPACSACRRCSATCRRSRRAEPRRGGQSRQGFRRTRGSPASAVPVGRITPWALSADT